MSDRSERKLRNALEKLARREREAYLRRSSVRFLQCAIHLCATHMTLSEIAELLEEEARQLRQYG